MKKYLPIIELVAKCSPYLGLTIALVIGMFVPFDRQLAVTTIVVAILCGSAVIATEISKASIRLTGMKEQIAVTVTLKNRTSLSTQVEIEDEQ